MLIIISVAFQSDRETLNSRFSNRHSCIVSSIVSFVLEWETLSTTNGVLIEIWTNACTIQL